MKYFYNQIAAIICILLIITNHTFAAVPKNFQASKYAAIVVDVNSGRTLFQHNAKLKRYPASLTKMMTIYLLFEALEEKRITLNTKLTVSQRAEKQPPTKLGLKAKQTISVKDAMLGLILRSANDAAVVVAEHLGGNEQRFVRMMNAKAQRLGMYKTQFQNPSGLPNVQQYTTAEDISLLAIALRRDFPQYYHYFSITNFVFRGNVIYGHNSLLGRIKGVDGLKTGYINMSGYNLASSVKLGNKSLVAVVMGGNTARHRDAHMHYLLERHLQRASNTKFLFSKNELLSSIPKQGDIIPTPTLISRPTQRNNNLANTAVARSTIKPTTEAINTVVNLPIKTSPVRNAVANTTTLKNTAEQLPTIMQKQIRPSTNPKRMLANKIDNNKNIQNKSAKPLSTIRALLQPKRWSIQVGSVATQESAQSLLKKIRNDTNRLLENTSSYTTTFVKNRKTFYRARFLGFSSRQQALNACKIIKQKGYQCYALDSKTNN